MGMSWVPEAGDVIVVPEARQSQLVYVVHAGGEAEQLIYHTRAEATARAVAYARSAGVNALYGNSAELGFVLLGRFRAGDGSHPPVAPGADESKGIIAKSGSED